MKFHATRHWNRIASLAVSRQGRRALELWT